MHRVIAEAKYGKELLKGKQVDHINRNTLDNTRDNLRLVTASENCRNRGKKSGASSKYIEVDYNKEKGKLRAHIKIWKVKSIHLGYFDIEAEVAREYTNSIKIIFKIILL